MHASKRTADGLPRSSPRSSRQPGIGLFEHWRTDHTIDSFEPAAHVLWSDSPVLLSRPVSARPRGLCECCLKDGFVALCLWQDPTQAIHQSREYALLFVVIAVPDSCSTPVAPDLRRQEEKTQSCGRQRRVLHRLDRSRFLAVEQHQPAV